MEVQAESSGQNIRLALDSRYPVKTLPRREEIPLLEAIAKQRD
jgi:hypothetical protein